MSVDTRRLDAHRYAFTQQITTRYSDLDAQSRTHEVAIGRMLESLRYGRLSFLFGPDECEPFESVTGRMTLRRPLPGRFEGVVIGAASISKIGRSSFEWETALFHEGRCFALSEMTQIVVDAAFRPSTMPQSLRDRLSTLLSP